MRWYWQAPKATRSRRWHIQSSRKEWHLFVYINGMLTQTSLCKKHHKPRIDDQRPHPPADALLCQNCIWMGLFLKKVFKEDPYG